MWCICCHRMLCEGSTGSEEELATNIRGLESGVREQVRQCITLSGTVCARVVPRHRPGTSNIHSTGTEHLSTVHMACEPHDVFSEYIHTATTQVRSTCVTQCPEDFVSATFWYFLALPILYGSESIMFLNCPSVCAYVHVCICVPGWINSLAGLPWTSGLLLALLTTASIFGLAGKG